MKNILSENMLRFGVKNLSESNKKRLTLESILQTINEHGLTEDIKRLLNEQQSIDIRGCVPLGGGMSGIMSAFSGAWNYDYPNPAMWRSDQSATRINVSGKGMLELDFVDLGFKASYNVAKQGGEKKNVGYAIAKPGFIYDAAKFIKVTDAVNQTEKVDVNDTGWQQEMAKEWNKSAFSQNWQGIIGIWGGYHKLKGFA